MASTGKTRKRVRIKRSERNARKKSKTPTLDKPNFPPKQENHNDDLDSDGSDSDADSDSDSDSESEPEKLSCLLEPYSKDQLIELISEAALKDSALFDRIRGLADRDVNHRKIFVHGLTWDTTREHLVSAFEPFGEIEECHVVLDKSTGKGKGYGFVQFSTRRAALKALKNPQKKIKSRLASCQLASLGPPANGPSPAQTQVQTPAQAQDGASGPRKIYVGNVPADADPERLMRFFAKFGEIETGPIGFDTQTGKSRGFALFLYKTTEGFRRAVQEPYKVFEGHQLHCQKAAEGKSKTHFAQPQPKPQPQPQPQPQAQAQALHQHPMLLAAAPNLAMFGHHPGFNAMYGGFFANPAAGMIPGSVNPALVAGTLSHGVIPTTQVGQASASVAGLGSLGAGSGSSSVLGSYGSNAAPPQPTTLQALQQVYPNPHFGQAAAAATTTTAKSGRVQGTGGAITGYPSYIWYDIFQLVFLFYSFFFMFLCFNFLLCLLTFRFYSILLFNDKFYVRFHCFSCLFCIGLKCLVLLLVFLVVTLRYFQFSTCRSFCGFRRDFCCS